VRQWRRAISSSPSFRAESQSYRIFDLLLASETEAGLSASGIRQRGGFVGAHRVLSAAAGMAGQTEVAATALQELRRAQPNISLAWIANKMPIMQGSELDRYREAAALAWIRIGLGRRSTNFRRFLSQLISYHPRPFTPAAPDQT